MLVVVAACGGPRGMGSTTSLDADQEDAHDAGAEPVMEAGGEEPLDAPSGEAALDAAGHEPGLDAGAEAAAPALDGAAGDGPAFRSSGGSTWEGTGMWSVEIVLPAPAAAPVILQLSASGSARAREDYQIEASTLTIPAGSQSARATIHIVDDKQVEGSESLRLTLVGVGVGAASGYELKIADDDDTRWPDDGTVSVVDASGAYAGENFSGLAYQPARAGSSAILWMVRNSPSTLYRLVQSGNLFMPSAVAGWSQGKALTFPNAGGAPDAEDVTWADWSSPRVYVVSERDGNGPSAPTILAYDSTQAGGTLAATRAWDLSDDLRALSLQPNTGPEALTWVPDSYLVSAGFRDEATGGAYDPARYPDHAGGLFLVGIEQTGGIYAYALNHTNGSAVRVASIESGQPGLMALEFDRDVNYLWAWCDDTCGNRATLLRVEDNPASPRAGRFGVRRRLDRPASLPNLNHEGMTLGPAGECQNDKKSVFWVEDGSDDHVLRRGTIPCAAFLDP